MSGEHPYAALPEHAFWRPAVADRHVADFADIWNPPEITRTDRIATAGSCFAQHIGRALRKRGANYLDLEPAPPFLDAAEAKRMGFGLFSCRYGNIYTSRQLVQLIEEAFATTPRPPHIWEKDGRFWDALRPGVDPAGVASPEIVAALRARHLTHVRNMFRSVDLFVFTLGFTECWEAVADGVAFPVAPGTIAGRFDPAAHRLRNLRHAEVLADMERFYACLRDVNSRARLLLTVSPVPLTATASGAHVLAATTYSKSVLRAVAGDLAIAHEGVSYFPSYEIIAAHPSRGMFFEPDFRRVNGLGVETVMRHFFSGPLAAAFPEPAGAGEPEEPVELVCEEERLDQRL